MASCRLLAPSLFVVMLVGTAINSFLAVQLHRPLLLLSQTTAIHAHAADVSLRDQQASALATGVPRQVQIAEGVLIPTVGFGTAGMGAQTLQAVLWALEAGYTLFDSAQAREWYREDLVGRAIQQSGIPRDRLFLTSKLHPRHHGYDSAAAQLNQSLKDLQTSYLDLFILHYPSCWGELCGDVSPEGTWRDSWRALEDAVVARTVRAIGVSNFDLSEIKELLQVDLRVKPAIVQRNSDPFSADSIVREFCESAGIQYQAYSSLGTQWVIRGIHPNPVLTSVAIQHIAQQHNVSTAQVVLRWALQHGQVVIPASTSQSHIQSNLDVYGFALSEIEMNHIDALDGTNPSTQNSRLSIL